jgi:hypothetical protein
MERAYETVKIIEVAEARLRAGAICINSNWGGWVGGGGWYNKCSEVIETLNLSRVRRAAGAKIERKRGRLGYASINS